MGIGQTAALAAAFFWAAASLLYGRTHLSAWGMNFAKNVLASLILLVQLFVLAGMRHTSVFSADAMGWTWLSLSGVLGIMIGDTCYFRSLQILGPRKALIISTSAPIFAAILGFLFLDEQITVILVTGITLTMSGVIFVVFDRTSSHESPGLYPGSVAAGVVAGVLGAVCQAGGAVCSKLGMERCDAIEASFIRLFVSAVGAFLVVSVSGELRNVLRRLWNRELLKRFVPAVLMGTWLGIWLSQVAYKHSTVSVTTTLLSTTPLFAIPLVRIVHGHRVTFIAVAGAIVAVCGVYLIVR